VQVTIYTVAYNEELMIPFFIKHYRTMFPECRIVVYDNQSTDRTVEIAKSYNCEVIQYDTNNKFSDRKNLEIKNNCWKDSKTSWNIVCDADELGCITREQLEFESGLGTSAIKFTGWNMVNMSEDPNNTSIDTLQYGEYTHYYDKTIAFDKSKISEINFSPGCHEALPQGDVKYSPNQYNLLHYKFIGEEYVVNRYRLLRSRLSEDNIKMGWGYHYSEAEEALRQSIKIKKHNAIKLI
jgi:glycosyltransferase involved in cell wall biosynthesis